MCKWKIMLSILNNNYSGKEVYIRKWLSVHLKIIKTRLIFMFNEKRTGKPYHKHLCPTLLCACGIHISWLKMPGLICWEEVEKFAGPSGLNYSCLAFQGGKASFKALEGGVRGGGVVRQAFLWIYPCLLCPH